MTGPESPCTGARAGLPGGKYHVHRLRICVLFPALPAKTSAESGWGAAGRAEHLRAADSRRVAGCAGYAAAAAAAVTTDLAAQQCHREHSPVRSRCLEEWCGQLEVQKARAAARLLSCGHESRDSAWQMARPNPFQQMQLKIGQGCFFLELMVE